MDASYLQLGRENVSTIIRLLSSLLGKSSDKKSAILGLSLTILGWQLFWWHKYSFWSRRNVRTPRPIPIMGNLLPFLLNPRQKLDLEWTKKYGKVFGYYIGTQPRLVCADPNVLKKICIKDFDVFPNHLFATHKNEIQQHTLINQKDDQWRMKRAVVSPSFSSARIKSMYKTLNEFGVELADAFRSRISDSIGGQQGAVIDPADLFGVYCITSTLCTFYGIDIRTGSGKANSNDQVLSEVTRKVLKQNPVRFAVSSLLPAKLLAWLKFSDFSSGPVKFLFKRAVKIIENRRNSQIIRNDVLQLLMDAQLNDKSDSDSSEELKNHHLAIDGAMMQSEQRKWRKMSSRLTQVEVSSLVTSFMFIATETTTALLRHATYLLAHHQDVQQKLYEVLREIRQANGSEAFKYDDLSSCKYLDCVINETLRLMPSIIFMDRVASDDYYIEEYDIHVPKGTVVELAYYAVQRDPDFWPEPDKFNPDRFSAENKPNIVQGSFIPFGLGPRVCVGYRYALIKAKIALATVVTQFMIDKAPGTKYPPENNKISFINNSYSNLLVTVRSRQ